MSEQRQNVLSRALLLGVDTGEYDSQASMDELRELTVTAGGEVAGIMIQQRPKPDNVTYLGSGKLEEALEFVEANGVDLVICDDEISPATVSNLSKILGVRVIDRTVLILDIFALSARTNEGKLQVELAQLQYTLPRLAGSSDNLSRLGGGIGTRGPGETKLETDRRHIRRRIEALAGKLSSVSDRRERLRGSRSKRGLPTVAIVGYTNAGKSTLMNTLTNAGVLTEDKLFATLDPTSRALKLPDGRTVLLSDTVGFISRLPHNLVQAFRSTLEEAVYADALMVICDASDPKCDEKLDITMETLRELGADNKPILTVYNKCDAAKGGFLGIPQKNTVRISAKTGFGIENLLEALTKVIPGLRKRVTVLLPFTEGRLASVVRENSRIYKEEYRYDGVYFDAVVDAALIRSLSPYMVDGRDM